ncbi:MAG: hypothetical protein HFJ80_04145 [Clostridiales bacterium]|nr:hypothetical protein [Clostridiales bacterium]
MMVYLKMGGWMTSFCYGRIFYDQTGDGILGPVRLRGSVAAQGAERHDPDL